MNYQSTRDKSISVSSAQAIKTGLSAEGGLFVPESFPTVSLKEIKELSSKSYNERAYFVLSKFLTDFTEEELKDCIEKAYKKEKFGTSSIAPLYKLSNTTYFLELWHGPTCAFKDMALQILPHLLTTSMKKTNGLHILFALLLCLLLHLFHRQIGTCDVCYKMTIILPAFRQAAKPSAIFSIAF